MGRGTFARERWLRAKQQSLDFQLLSLTDEASNANQKATKQQSELKVHYVFRLSCSDAQLFLYPAQLGRVSLNSGQHSHLPVC